MEPQGQMKLMRQPTSYGILALVLLFLSISYEISVFASTNATLFDRFNPMAMLALFLGGSIMLSFVNSKIAYDDTKLIYQSMFRKRKEILWSENPAIRYDQKVVRVVSAHQSIDVNPSRQGFNDFLEFALQKVKAHEAAANPQPQSTRAANEGEKMDTESWTSVIAGAAAALIAVWGYYKKDPGSFGLLLIFFSVMFAIGGGVSLSKRHRAKQRKFAILQFPDRIAKIEAPGADKRALRMAQFMLLASLIIFLIWLRFYGWSSFAIGV